MSSELRVIVQNNPQLITTCPLINFTHVISGLRGP